ncbi:MAG: Flp pilus assembly protein CpaB [Anaerolineae bacterium]|nr:Flp pilus assembly protein CpaB [Anaerolineae bacterium]MDW8100351.1 Flp pilus assembly protein CpaB [Anaerolineae bacterium]
MQRKRGWVWLTSGIVLALLAGLLSFRMLAQAAAAASQAQRVEMSSVVVAVQDIPLRSVIREGQVAVKQVPTELVPAGAAVSLADAVGKIARQEIAAGEIVLTHRLVEPTVKGRDIAFTMPEDKVVIALPASDLMSQLGFLKPGDRVDLLFTVRVPSVAEEKLVTLNAIQNLEIAAMAMPPLLSETNIQEDQGPTTVLSNKGALLFAVSAQDALTIKFLKDSGAILDIALRAPTSEQMLEAEAVDMPYVADRYKFSPASAP